jgi:integrase
VSAILAAGKNRNFSPVLDSRKRRIKGMSLRNGRFYGAVWQTSHTGEKSCRRFLLKDESGFPASCIRQARDSYARLKVKANEPTQHKPPINFTLGEYASEYIQSSTIRSKSKRTIEKESQCLGIWSAMHGKKRIDQINTALVRNFIENRLAGLNSEKKNYPPVSIRTVAIDLIVLRNLLKSALDQGIILDLPRFPKLKSPPPPRKEMVTDLEFQLLIEGCSKVKPCGEAVTKNGSQLSDLLILLDCCGIRETEAYAIAWNHVDFMGKKLWVGVDPDFNASVASIGTGGKTKNRKSRYIDMSIPLEEHLLQMRKRSHGSKWLFPSPKRGAIDRPIISFRESLNLVKSAVGIEKFGFHDCRHRFASRCVMSGIDYMTIAKWLGHQDGGILVGRVYGHLSDEHQKAMARRLSGLTTSRGIENPSAFRIA